MNAYIFLGPTLRVKQAREYLDAVYCPPVQQGEILRVLRHNPTVIGIVDGYFETVPSVWHKEILVAMSRGVHVFGASSMGALRAAELHQFGMVGVGKIFELYRTGELEDDDEVAIAHGSADSGFVQLSEAMVNMRDTLQAAVAAGIIPTEAGSTLVTLAKRLHYADRCYQHVLELARKHLDAVHLRGLPAFIESYHPKLKERDAILMLQRIALFLSEGPPPLRVPYSVEQTVFLDSLLNEIERSAPETEILSIVGIDARNDARTTQRRESLFRLLARMEAARLGIECAPGELQESVNALRGQIDGVEMRGWRDAAGLSEEAFFAFARDARLLEKLDHFYDAEIEENIADRVRLQRGCKRRS